MGDWNGDERIDLAVAYTNSASSSGNVTILLGNGSGGFSSGPSVPAVPVPTSVAVGDLNRDGKLDLAVGNFNERAVRILLGNGSGGFTSGPSAAVGYWPKYVGVGDWNGDAKLDLAVTSLQNNTVTILLGDGAGLFNPAAGSPISVGTGPHCATAGDWNRDGQLDLAVPGFNDRNVTILLGNGSGGFNQAAGSPIALETYPLGVGAGDWNGDGKLDLALAGTNSGVAILLGSGTGTFSPAPGSPFGTGTNPRSIAVGDLNADGKLDLAVANNSSHNVTILLGNGSGAFVAAAGSPVAVGSYPVSISAGDVNGDGVSDLAVANGLYGGGSVSIVLNNSPRVGCNDANLCTTDTCISASGCRHDPVSCADSNACTIDSCGTTSGCRHDVASCGESASVMASAGGTATTDSEADGATPLDPIETTVTTPNAGTVTIDESQATPLPTVGFSFFNILVHVTAPPATASNPLILSFRIDASVLPPGFNVGTLEVFKDGVLLATCTGPSGTASPDPCISNRSLAADGDAEVTVLTSTLSTFVFAMPSCDDADLCTVDSGVPLSCSSSPVVCAPVNECRLAGTCDGSTGLCSNPIAETGTVCDDGDRCTVDDACSDGTCTGALEPIPAEVNDTVRLAKEGGAVSIGWTEGPGTFNLYRGSIPSGSEWFYDLECLVDGTSSQSATDTLAAPLGTLVFYLVARDGDCVESILGRQDDGTPIPNPLTCSILGADPGE